jgi:hypothetical protein
MLGSRALPAIAARGGGMPVVISLAANASVVSVSPSLAAAISPVETVRRNEKSQARGRLWHGPCVVFHKPRATGRNRVNTSATPKIGLLRARRAKRSSNRSK